MRAVNERRTRSAAIEDLIAAENAVLGEASPEGRSALCLSGGGIRSAAFSLGVLQALARAGWLSKFDYLSTVSGGGYIGSWLSAWTSRAGQNIRSVELALANPVEPEELQSLRRTSNYLSPRRGFSADFLSLISTYLRNLLINWAVTIPFLVAVALLVTVVFHLHAFIADHDQVWSPVVGQLVAVAGLIVASAYTASDIPWASEHQTLASGFRRWVLVPIVLICVVLSICFFYEMRMGRNPVAEVYPRWKEQHLLSAANLAIVAYAAGTLIGLAIIRPRRKVHASGSRKEYDRFDAGGLFMTTVISAVVVVLAMAYGYQLAFWIATQVARMFPDSGISDLLGAVVIMLAVPTLLASFAIGNLVQLAISRRQLDDWAREWWARSGGIWLLAAGAWLLAIPIFVFAPAILRAMPMSALFAAIGGAFTAFFAYYSKTGSPGTDGANDAGLLAKLSVSLLDLLSVAFILVVLTLAGLAASLVMSAWGVPGAAIGVVILAAFSVGAAWIVGANRFSLNAMYRLRLVRAFLGSSREDRRPHAFTGFDPDDDVPFAKLAGKPLHLINAAFNLNARKPMRVRDAMASDAVSDQNFQQERRAISFVFSRAGYGCELWSSTRLPDDVKLGSAMAISGAAASPHMGYHTSKPTAFVLAFFNLRLGWWLRRPVQSEEASTSEPHCPWRALLSEYFANTTGRRGSIYLSDGGHFENLGLFEMLRRRCARIVVVDASCDAEFEFADVERLLRLARVDLGVRIENEEGLPTPESAKATMCHHALWRVTYPQEGTVPERTGVILYIKPVMSSDESIDILRRAANAKTARFPHEPTSDQFYDEAQFESYRQLGIHGGEKAIGNSGFLDVSWLDSVDRVVNPKHERWSADRAIRLGLASAARGSRGAAIVESVKSVFQVDSLPATLATLTGIGYLGANALPNFSPSVAIVAPPEESSDIAAVMIPMIPMLESVGGRVMLPIFEEAKGCDMVGGNFVCETGDGKELADAGIADGRPMRDALGRLASRMSECGIDAGQVKVVGYSSSSEFAANGTNPQPNSLEAKLRLADARAANVAASLGTYKDRAFVWMEGPRLDILARHDAMRQRQVLERATEARFVRTAGGINRRVDIEIDAFGSCGMTDLVDAFLKSKAADPRVAQAD